MQKNRNNTVVFSLPEKGYQGQVISSEHSFLVDEPKEVGGTNKSPNPTNYLLGALASCTAITLRMFTQRKGWEVGKIKVGVTLNESLSAEGKKYIISKELHFGNMSLNEEQHARLIEIADKCPISKILKAQVEMKEKVVDEIKERIVKEYKNEDITVVWKPNLCIHSKKCWRGLLPVFNPQKKPWVNMSGADTETIVNQVNQCPSGALSCYTNEEVSEG